MCNTTLFCIVPLLFFVVFNLSLVCFQLVSKLFTPYIEIVCGTLFHLYIAYFIKNQYLCIHTPFTHHKRD